MDEINSLDLTLKEYLRDLIDNVAVKLKYSTYKFTINSVFAKGENYLGEIKRATIEGVKNNGEKETLHLILKTPPDNEALRKEMPLNSVYGREIYAYNDFLPAIDKLQTECKIKDEDKFKFARCFSASANNKAEAIIFEDLAKKGFKMYDRLNPIDRDHVMIVVSTLAEFHALSFAAKEKLPEQYEDFKSHTYQRDSLGDNFENTLSKLWDSSVQHIKDEHHLQKLNKFKGNNLSEKMNDYMNLSISGDNGRYNIITHGDSWINNMMFKYKDSKVEKMILVDWQMIKYSSPMTDLFYFLFACMDEDIRNELWDEILSTYYSTLKNRLKDLQCNPEKCYPEREFKRDIEDFGGFGLIMAMMTVPLFLIKRENSLSAGDMIGDDGFEFGKITVSDECIERLNGVVRDCIKLNIL